MLNHKKLIIVSILLLAVIAMPSWSATFRWKTAIDYARNNPELKGTDALKRLEELSS